MTSHLDRETQLERIKSAIYGNQDERRIAFDDLVAIYQPYAERYAYHILHDHHLAQDAVQEAFLVAYLRIDQLREPKAFWAWLKRIILTQCDRMVRGIKPTFEPIEMRYDLADDALAPEAEIEHRELQRGLQQAIASLPEHERTVTESYYMQGQSQKEIAHALAIPVTTVKKRLQYAREHLRMVVGGINAVFDQAIADWLNPPDTEEQQRAYAYQTQSIKPEEASHWHEDDF